MKFRLSLLLSIALLLQSVLFAQSSKRFPIVAEEEIKSIIVSGNVHILLVEDQPSNSGVRAEAAMIEKLRISISGDRLYIAPSKKALVNEEIRVYVRVNQLRRLELQGNSVATSFGVLNSKNLNVVLSPKSRLALKSNGEVQVTTPRDFQMSKENGYYSVYSLGAM